MFRNILKVLKNPNSFIIWFFALIAAFVLWFLYSDIDYVAANYDSHIFAYIDMGLSWVMILLLPLMVAGIFYRSFYFGLAWATDRPSEFLGILAWGLSAVISGTACCGVSLISVLGLTSVLSFLDMFPYHGVELKAVGILLLIYSFIDLYRNLEVCKRKKSHS